jgi:hypothetical protein
LVQPVMIDREGVIFLRWDGDSSEASPVILVRVDSPMAVEAQWSSLPDPSGGPSGLEFAELLLSLAVFLISVFLNLKRPRRELEA